MNSHLDLVSQYGSPLYVYDLDDLGRATEGLRAVLPEGATVFYSLKANPHPDVAAELRRLGCRAEVSSTGELDTALAAGFLPEECVYSGPGKTEEELRHAADAGVGLYSAESPADLRRIGAAALRTGAVAHCLLRVNAAAGAGRSAIRMTGRPSQFGFDVEDIDSWAVQAARTDGIVLDGLHFFPVSNTRDEQALFESFEESIATAALLQNAYGLPLRFLDLGGGFAAPYARPGERPSYEGLRARLEAALDRHFPERATSGPTVAFESGRYLTGGCGQLLTTVVDVKRSKGVRYVVLDAGINHLGGMAGLRRMMPLAAQPHVGEDAAPLETVTLAGPLCAPSDTLGLEVKIPLPAIGDVLTIPHVGAYGLAASLVMFLGRPLPVELSVRTGELVSVSRQHTVRRAVEQPAHPARRGEGDARLRDLAGDLVPTLREHAHEVDVRAEFPTASLRALRESGLMGLMVPSEYGGLNGTPQDLAAVSQVLAGGCLSTAMIFAMHCQQADALVMFARHELKERLLPRIADGSLYLASITSEENKGGHLLTSAAPLRPVDDGLRVSRVAPVVTGGAHADGYLVTMRSGPEAPAHAVTLVYVDRRQADLEFHGHWDPMGMRGTHSAGLKLEAVVPPEQIVGTEGEFRAVALQSFMPLAHIGWSACWLGAAQQSLRELIALLRSPRRPRSLDLSSDLLHERVARIRHNLELTGSYLRRTADEVTSLRGSDGDMEAPRVQVHLNTLKVMAAELTFDAADRCVQLAGLGQGYLRNSTTSLERTLRDLRSASLNYSNDRLLKANGLLSLADPSVTLL